MCLGPMISREPVSSVSLPWTANQQVRGLITASVWNMLGLRPTIYFILFYNHTSSWHCVGSHVYWALPCAKQTLMSSIYHPFIQSVSSPAQYHCKDASYPSKSLVATGYPVQQIQIKCVHAVTYIIKTERPVAVCFTIHYYDTQKSYQYNFGLKLITM